LHLQQALLQRGSTPIEHILVLHPAHHVYLQGCAVSGASVLETPLGNLTVDDELRKEILALSPSFTVMDASTDNEEHSGEMQYPYLAKLLQNTSIPVLPIMCGALTTSQEQSFGKLLRPIIARPNVVCVISSDFCHWGSRFRFQPTSKEMPIHQFIREMDHQGMDLIALQKPGAFAEYLKTTKNTICGRHAISVWLNAVATQDGAQQQQLTVKFVKYAQSSAVESMHDSSVSYASAVATST
jgi:MEMO1 family protein